MMEQEVFKAFVSGNPLDGLYKYLKKHTLVSQIKDKPEVPHFVTICYIKEIQRARKKGFFVKVEDVTETFEFFVPDPCGLEKFDMLILHGYRRANRTQITKIIKTSHDKLKELAGSSYDPADTVAKVKKMRYGERKQEEIERLKADATPIMKERQVLNLSEEEPSELPLSGEVDDNIENDTSETDNCTP